MRLLIVIPSFYPAIGYGGPIFTSYYTANELSKLYIEVRVATTNANLDRKLDILPNVWHKMGNKFFVKYYNETIINKFSVALFFNLWKDIRESDIVHIQGLFSTPVPIALFYASFFNKKILLTPHGTLGKWCINSGSRLKSLWLKLLIQPFNKKVIWHATSQQEKEEILALFPEAKVIVIPNGIKFEEFQNYNILSKEEYSKKFTGKKLTANKIIVSMGRLQKKKGFDILIDAFNHVLKEYPDAKLLIAGGDEGEKENLKKQIKKLNLENKVFLIGLIKGQDKIDFLANADLFVLPSHNENFGVVFAESLAAGTPIIASKNTPWQEVEKYNCGKWVENSVEATARAIDEMLRKDKEIMRQNAKQYAKKYDWSNIAVRFKELFEEMIK